MRDEADVADLISSRIPAAQLATARLVAGAAEEAGTEPYLVGGAVRDALLGRAPTGDLDITLVGADAATFSQIALTVGGRISKSSQFNTARLEIGNHSLDLTMARAETYPQAGSLPVVRPGTINEDLARRDFSVNAMAVSLEEDRWGMLFDPHGGQEDLREGRLRTLHEGSFRDDATRILRAARYAARLSFDLDDITRRSLGNSIEFLSTISPARIRNDLERIFLEASTALTTLRMLERWGTLSAIHGALEFDLAAWRRYGQESGSLSLQSRVAVGFAVLGAKLRVSDAEGVAARLGLGSLNGRVLTESADLAGRLSEADLSGMSNAQLAELLDPFHRHTVAGCALASPGKVSERVGQYLSDLRDMRPELDGNDLVDMGVPHGPEVGRILRRLRSAKLNGAVQTPDEERALVMRLLRTGSD